MGSTSSAELQHLQCPCAVIQLRNWKDDDKDKLIVVPVTEEAFAHSADHPLFQLLHTARNEPAVRHWYAGSGASSTVDRTSELEPHISAAAYYAEVFPAHNNNTGGQSGSVGSVGNASLTESTHSRRSSSSSSSSCSPNVVSRWMMLSVPASNLAAAAVKDSFLTVDQVCALATASGSGITAAGFIECSHATLATTLRYWMVKTFSTEGRSLVLFQVAAFMEARRMHLANLRAVNPAAVELVLRAGDSSTLRTLEWSFRKLLPETSSVALHRYVTVTSKASINALQVRLDLGALTEILQSLELAVRYPSQQLKPCTLVSLVVDQRPVERIPTPFTSFVEVAKEIWSRENAVVVQVQPNQRRQKSTANTTPMDGSCELSSSRTSSANGNTGSGKTSPRMHSFNTATSHSSTTPSRGTSPRQSLTLPQLPPLHYRLANNTPVHTYNSATGQWTPLWYVDQGARLEVAQSQPFRADGKVLLETEDSLLMLDAEENFITIPALVTCQQQRLAKTQIVVSAGSYATQQQALGFPQLIGGSPTSGRTVQLFA